MGTITKRDLTMWGTALLLPILSVLAWVVTTTITNADGISDVRSRADRFETQINQKVDKLDTKVDTVLLNVKVLVDRL